MAFNTTANRIGQRVLKHEPTVGLSGQCEEETRKIFMN